MKGNIGYIEGYEGDYCNIEIEGTVEAIPKRNVDANAKTGDVVEWNGKRWVPNSVLTRKRTRDIKKLMDDVWED